MTRTLLTDVNYFYINRMKWFLVVVFMSILFSISYAQDTSEVIHNPELFLEKSMPLFSGTSLKNISWNNEKLKGKVVFLNFWFIGCMPCMKEIVHLNKLNKKYKGKDFVILSIAPQLREDLLAYNDTIKISTQSKVRNALKASTIDYEIIPACTKRQIISTPERESIGIECSNIVKDFYVNEYPTSMIVDKNGIVKYISSGFNITGEDQELIIKYQSIIEQLLKK